MSIASQEIGSSGRSSFWSSAESGTTSASTAVHKFLIFEFTCQVAILFDLGPLRPLARIAAFGGSLLLLVLLQGRVTSHPAKSAVNWVIVLVCVAILHPTTSSLLGGIAHASLYLAIIAPIFWVSRIGLDKKALREIMLIFWLFYTASAGVGVMQVYLPGTFQPMLSPVVRALGKGYLDSLMITTASGQRVFRPTGLTDNPGGAAFGGFYAILFGAGFLFTRGNVLLKAGSVAAIAVGVICLYLCQVRSVAVIAAISMVVFSSILLLRLRMIKLTLLVAVLGFVIIAGLTWSTLLYDEKAINRLSTLNVPQPGEVYYNSRGHYLEETVNDLLPMYPLGAGLARWGMMYYYFGRDADTNLPSIYVEIQWTGWLLDGGIPLVLAYFAALVITCRIAWRVIRETPTADPEGLWIWAALLLAFDIAVIALTFSYTPFIGQAGLEFWLLNAVLFSVARSSYPQLFPSVKVW